MRLRGFLPTVGVLVLAGCADMSVRQGGELDFVTRQTAAAEQAEADGHLAVALDLWYSILTVDPQNAQVRDQIGELQQAIDQRVEVALKRGKAAYAAGNAKEGDTWMLKVLAIEPDQEQALAGLRQSASRRNQAKQNAKSEKEMRQMIARRRAAPDSPQSRIRALYGQGDYQTLIEAAAKLDLKTDRDTARLLHLSHLALADQLAGKGDREGELGQLTTALSVYPEAGAPLAKRVSRVAKSLSDSWYKKGNASMKSDLPAAIAALEKAVEYDPQNKAAKLRLDRARILKRNLDKIKKR